MKRYLRIASTILLLLTVIATVAGCVYICTPPPGTDTGDIGWKLDTTLFPMLAAMALVWESMVYSCILYFLWDRARWSIPLTVLVTLLLLALLAVPFLLLV